MDPIRSIEENYKCLSESIANVSNSVTVPMQLEAVQVEGSGEKSFKELQLEALNNELSTLQNDKSDKMEIIKKEEKEAKADYKAAIKSIEAEERKDKADYEATKKKLKQLKEQDEGLIKEREEMCFGNQDLIKACISSRGTIERVFEENMKISIEEYRSALKKHAESKNEAKEEVNEKCEDIKERKKNINITFGNDKKRLVRKINALKKSKLINESWKSPYTNISFSYSKIIINNMRILKKINATSLSPETIDCLRKSRRLSFFNIVAIEKLMYLNYALRIKLAIPFDISLPILSNEKNTKFRAELEDIDGFIPIVNLYIKNFIADVLYGGFPEPSPEAYIRFLLWDPILNMLLLNGGMKIAPEYCCSKQFQQHADPQSVPLKHRVDIVALADLGKVGHVPLFFVEVSSAPLDPKGESKDYSKMVFDMTNSLLFLVGKTWNEPEFIKDIRIYGAFIGGTDIQFCVLFPRVINGKLEVYFKSSKQEWRFNIFDQASLSDKDVKNGAFFCNPLVDNDIIKKRSNVDPCIKEEDYDILDELDRCRISEIDNLENEIFTNKEEILNGPLLLKYLENTTPKKCKTDSKKPLCQVSYQTLWVLKRLIDHISSMKTKFEDHFSLHTPGKGEGQPIRFSQNYMHYIPKGTNSLSGPISYPDVSSSGNSIPNSLDEHFILTKPYNEIEYSILSHSNPLNCEFIPLVYSIIRPSQNSKLITYNIEKMISHHSHLKSSIRQPQNFFIISLKFILATLCSLDYLHSKSYVHGNICEDYVAFSCFGCTWKLCSFCTSTMTFSEAARKKIDVSKVKYSNLDLQLTRIYKPYMDIYALLATFKEFWLDKFSVPGEIQKEGFGNDRIRRTISFVNACTASSSPAQHLTIKKVLKEFLSIYKEECTAIGKVSGRRYIISKFICDRNDADGAEGDVVASGASSHRSSIETVPIGPIT